MLNLTSKSFIETVNKDLVLEPENKSLVVSLLTYESVPTTEDIETKVYDLVQYAISTNTTKALIGGENFYISSLELALLSHSIKPYFEFVDEKGNVSLIESSLSVDGIEEINT